MILFFTKPVICCIIKVKYDVRKGIIGMAKYVLSAFADEVTNVFEEQLKYLNKHKIGYIEPRNIDGTNVSSLTLDEAKNAKKLMDDYGVKAYSIGSPVGKVDITGDLEEHMKLFRHTLDIAEIFESKNIRMFSFFYPEGTDVHDYRGNIIEELAKMLDEAEKRGVKLCHENEARIYGETPKDCADLMKHFGGRMKSVLDMGNFAFCRQNPLEGYELLEEYIEYIHIKDAFPDGTIVAAGNGEGKISEILTRYNAYTDREVVLTLEPHLTVFDGLQNLSNMDDIKVQNAYASPEAAFDAAIKALNDILVNIK